MDMRIDVNLAGEDELRSLPGVGPVLARRIVAHRRRNGRFETVEDLVAVKGVGEATLEALREYLLAGAGGDAQ